MELLPPILCLLGITLTGLFMLAMGWPGLFLVAVGIWLLGAWPGVSMGFTPWAWQPLAALLGVALLGEVLEFLAILAGGSKLQLSRPAMFCGVAGGLVGAFVGSPAGPLGAVFSSWLGLVVFVVFWLVAFENESALEGLKGGLRALLARLIGLGVKSGVMMGMVIWAGFQWFIHRGHHP